MVKEVLDDKGYIESISGKLQYFTDPLAGKLLNLFDLMTEYDEDAASDDAKNKVESVFKSKFAERVIIYVPLAILSILIVGGIDSIFCGDLPNQTYGLAIDLFGAMILGRGLLRGGIAIGTVTRTQLNYNVSLAKAMAKDSVDGVWGIFLILVGIVLQFIAVGRIYPDIPIWLSASC